MVEPIITSNLARFDPVLRVVAGEEARLSLSEWRDRLRRDPDATVVELVRSFGHRRSEDQDVEDLFWRVVVDFVDAAELARTVIGRLRRPGAGSAATAHGLLDIDFEHRVRARGRLRVAAAEALRGVVRDAEALERIVEHPSRLPEAAFALRGRPEAAAALYALEHDHLESEPVEDGPGADQTRTAGPERLLGRAALRYEVARALHRTAGGDVAAGAIMQSAVDLVEETLAAPGSAESEWPTVARRLSFHAREWLGLRHFESGRYAEAASEFLRAAEAAPETDLAIATKMFAANAMIRDDRCDPARRLLDSLRVDAQRLSPPMADEWLEMRARLFEPPGDSDSSG